jgi:hypothetical protein
MKNCQGSRPGEIPDLFHKVTEQVASIKSCIQDVKGVLKFHLRWIIRRLALPLSKTCVKIILLINHGVRYALLVQMLDLEN